VTDSSDREDPPPIDRTPPFGSSWRQKIIVTIGLTVAALALVLLGGRDAYRSTVLAVRGKAVSGTVLFVRYGSRADEVKVHLSEPVNRDVELVAWIGHPRVGQTIRVRYDSGNPGLAKQDGSQLWDAIALAFGAAVWLLFGAWWGASSYCGRRYGWAWLQRPRWLARR
jgi:hypothetical protein